MYSHPLVLRFACAALAVSLIGCASSTTAPPPLARIEIVGPGGPGAIFGGAGPGVSIQLSARTLAENGEVLDLPITWSAADATIATVDQTGLVRTHRSGRAIITATATDQRSTVQATFTFSVITVV